MSITTISNSAAGITFWCPNGTADAGKWTYKQAPGLDNMPVATGADCTATVTFQGAQGWFTGAQGPGAGLYGCTLENVDIASGWQWYSAEQEQAVYGSASCHWKGLGVNNTQNATIRNNPAGGTQLWIESFSYTAESGDAVGSAGKATDPPDLSYTAPTSTASKTASSSKAASSDASTTPSDGASTTDPSNQTPATTPLGDLPTSSLSPSSSLSNSGSTSSATGSSAAASSTSSSTSSSGFDGPYKYVYIGGIIVIVTMVMCVIGALACTKTKPTAGDAEDDAERAALVQSLAPETRRRRRRPPSESDEDSSD